MVKLKIQTKARRQIVDITSEINRSVSRAKVREGICHVFVLHTTCAVTTADLDPGTDEDFLDAIGKMFPKGLYRHPHDPSHVGEHIMSSIIGPSLNIPVSSGKLDLGTWQRVILVELSGPRERNIQVDFA
ncbi:hypothetical protein A2115_02900 [Candidatus Woesebacteria bacterium GWA1_41_8]|uniref:Secondary thiamine-phosphate synthase enzyme n=1 Tax=Candidatus Woesebacteria bacterium GWA1_41_8 TaxID=1802471 RepID=A0A1F7WJQ3_9BACT|nr:MAG: hypothetical protein A2115_02900 [Candidatus Woesebacteria bacterium GWA1_41_8]